MDQEPPDDVSIESAAFSKPQSKAQLNVVQQPDESSAYPGSENARSMNELERRTAKVYGTYFGPNWRDVLHRELLINVRAATTQDLVNNPGVRGFVATQAEVLSDSKKLVRNHIILFSNPLSLD